MPHDTYFREIKIGDVIKTEPFNQKPLRIHIGVVQSIKEDDQKCSGQISFHKDGGVVSDYFAAGKSILLLKANGDAPDSRMNVMTHYDDITKGSLLDDKTMQRRLMNNASMLADSLYSEDSHHMNNKERGDVAEAYEKGAIWRNGLDQTKS